MKKVNGRNRKLFKFSKLLILSLRPRGQYWATDQGLRTPDLKRHLHSISPDSYSILSYPYHSLFYCFSDSILICDWSIRNDRFKKKSNNKVLLVLLLVSHQHVDHMSLLLPRSLHCPVTVGELILNKRPTAENGPSGWNIRQLILIPVAAEAQEQRWSRGVEGDQLLTFPKMQFNHCSPVP